MKFGILGALKEEIELILATITAIETIQHGNNTYYCGTIDQHQVVLVSSGMGKVAAASTVTSLITYFNVDEIIVTGLAGAVSPALNIGDIVISRTMYNVHNTYVPIFKARAGAMLYRVEKADQSKNGGGKH